MVSKPTLTPPLINPPFKTHNLLMGQNIAHGFFGRKGGVSETHTHKKTQKNGNYASLNTGQGSGDDPQAIRENRQRVARALGTSKDNLISLHQYHSTEVVTHTTPLSPNLDPTRPKADGHVTQIPNLALSALGADCGPVLFFEPQTRIIGACHAGWRGAVTGITDATLEAMEALGAKREHIRAVLGPCISQVNYEVGAEFQNQFIERDPNYTVFFKSKIGHSRTPRAHFDLKAFILARLRKAGLQHVAALPDCTYAQADEYFSYRYNTHHALGDYGRNISAIMLTE